MSIKIYIDTNIYLNSILNRDEKISQKVLSFKEFNRVVGLELDNWV